MPHHEAVTEGAVQDVPAAESRAPGGIRAVSDRVDDLITALVRAGADDLRGEVEEAVRLLMELYGAGVARMLEIVVEDEAAAGVLLPALRSDAMIAELIELHGITFHRDVDASAVAPPSDAAGGRTAAGGRNLRQVGDRVEELVRRFSEIPDPGLKDPAEEVVRLLVGLYGEALERVLVVVDDAGEQFWGLFDRFGGDELVRSLLILHGLHPSDLDTRIMEALEKVRPYLNSHGGNVEVLSLDDAGVLTLRLQGSCQGCPSSTLTLKLAIERAVREAAPEITAVRAEGLEEPAKKEPATRGGLLQIQKHPGAPAPEPVDEWAELDADTAAVAAGHLAKLELQGASIVVCRVGESLYAYRDGCPGCGSGIAGGRLMGSALVCPGCERTYDVRLAGRCLDAEGLHLDPLPLLSEEGVVRVALGAAP
jgi:Fe-S cluster biogenesis protein NfuA/nitrite reductase/ring-hydroxylating ferredoxin subunit